ncbi:MAG: hypothetical protein IPO94_18900 [Saprospiraceae bacterium]|nr:hypothetical protein [Saprospiraceae bacterium]
MVTELMVVIAALEEIVIVFAPLAFDALKFNTVVKVQDAPLELIKFVVPPVIWQS